MTPNPELRDLILRAYEILTTGEGEPAELFADEEGVLAIGSDPDEWWVGNERIAGVFRAQGEALRGTRIENSDPVAYAEGDVGWVADRPTMVLRDGAAVEFRITATAVRSEATWRFVQWHGSVPVRNVNVVGSDLPV